MITSGSRQASSGCFQTRLGRGTLSALPPSACDAPAVRPRRPRPPVTIKAEGTVRLRSKKCSLYSTLEVDDELQNKTKMKIFFLKDCPYNAYKTSNGWSSQKFRQIKLILMY